MKKAVLLVLSSIFLVTSTGFSGQLIGTDDIADGAVTDAKIMGPISANKIVGGVFQTKPANIIYVAKNGGDFTTVKEALDSITDASAENPYLVKILPGSYNLQEIPGGVCIKNYVDVEGSGRNLTKLYTPPMSGDPMSGTNAISFCSDSLTADLRDLTIQMSTPSWTGCNQSIGLDAIWVNAGSHRIDNVSIEITGGNHSSAIRLFQGAHLIGNGLDIQMNNFGCTYPYPDTPFNLYQDSKLELYNSNAFVTSYGRAFTASPGADIKIKNSKFDKASAEVITSIGSNGNPVTATINNSEVNYYISVGAGGDLKGANNVIEGIGNSGGSVKMQYSVNSSYDPLVVQ